MSLTVCSVSDMNEANYVQRVDTSITGRYVTSDLTCRTLQAIIVLLKSAKKCLRREQPKVESGRGRWRVTKPRLAALLMTS